MEIYTAIQPVPIAHRAVTNLNNGIHPGAILKNEIEKIGISQRQLAIRMDRPYQAINEIMRGKKSITADTALQLEEALNIEAIYWLEIQAEFDLRQARISLMKANLL